MRHQNDHLPNSPSSCLTRETETALYPSPCIVHIALYLVSVKGTETLPNQFTPPGNQQLRELHASPRAAQPPRQSFRDRGLRHSRPHRLRSPLRGQSPRESYSRIRLQRYLKPRHTQRRSLVSSFLSQSRDQPAPIHQHDPAELNAGCARLRTPTLFRTPGNTRGLSRSPRDTQARPDSVPKLHSVRHRSGHQPMATASVSAIDQRQRTVSTAVIH